MNGTSSWKVELRCFIWKNKSQNKWLAVPPCVKSKKPRLKVSFQWDSKHQIVFRFNVGFFVFFASYFLLFLSFTNIVKRFLIFSIRSKSWAISISLYCEISPVIRIVYLSDLSDFSLKNSRLFFVFFVFCNLFKLLVFNKKDK